MDITTHAETDLEPKIQMIVTAINLAKKYYTGELEGYPPDLRSIIFECYVSLTRSNLPETVVKALQESLKDVNLDNESHRRSAVRILLRAFVWEILFPKLRNIQFQDQDGTQRNMGEFVLLFCPEQNLSKFHSAWSELEHFLFHPFDLEGEKQE